MNQSLETIKNEILDLLPKVSLNSYQTVAEIIGYRLPHVIDKDPVLKENFEKRYFYFARLRRNKDFIKIEERFINAFIGILRHVAHDEGSLYRKWVADYLFIIISNFNTDKSKANKLFIGEGNTRAAISEQAKLLLNITSYYSLAHDMDNQDPLTFQNLKNRVEEQCNLMYRTVKKFYSVTSPRLVKRFNEVQKKYKDLLVAEPARLHLREIEKFNAFSFALRGDDLDNPLNKAKIIMPTDLNGMKNSLKIVLKVIAVLQSPLITVAQQEKTIHVKVRITYSTRTGKGYISPSNKSFTLTLGKMPAKVFKVLIEHGECKLNDIKELWDYDTDREAKERAYAICKYLRDQLGLDVSELVLNNGNIIFSEEVAFEAADSSVSP